MEYQKYSRPMDCGKCHKSNNCGHEDKDKKVCKKVELCWHEEDKCGHKEDKCRHEDKKCRCHKEDDNNCKSCICDQLKKLEPAALLDLFFAGRVLRVNFVSLDSKNCCAYFLEAGVPSPLIIDCNKIDAIRKIV